MGKRKELIDSTLGQKFGMLKVLSISGRKNKNVTFNCLCDCGNKRVAIGHHLRKGITKSCGCLSKSCLNLRYKHGQCTQYRVTPIYRMWTSAKFRARRDKIPFNLQLEDMPSIPKKCPILGIPIISGLGKTISNSPSLDKIIPIRGYVKGNVSIISSRANLLKNSMTAKELNSILKYIKRNTNGPTR